ncbi:MAG: TIGR04551 family protein [Polyangiales bacterium]
MLSRQAWAQAEPNTADEESSSDLEADAAEGSQEERRTEDEIDPQGGPPRLRAPSISPLDLPPPAPTSESVPADAASSAASQREALDEAASEDAALLDQAAGAPTADPTVIPAWHGEQPTLTLHGYFRVRGELQHKFFLDREAVDGAANDLPFSRFRPLEDARTPEGGCSGDGVATGNDELEACNANTLRFANMRMRLRPTLSLSEDLRVHMMVDVFDNLVLGSTPDSVAYIPPSGTDSGYSTAPRTPGAGLDTFSTTALPPSGGRNSLQDSLVVRRAWAEVTNRSLGQLRFGRMGWHFGLGILANDGSGIDGDFSSDVDRIMGVTKLGDWFIAGMFDFAGEGFVQQGVGDVAAIAYDAGQRDDVTQLGLAVARRLNPMQERKELELGRAVVQGGLQFLFRKQFLSSAGVRDPFVSQDEARGDSFSVLRRDAWSITPDLWAQLKYKSLRIELESVLTYGQIGDLDIVDPTRDYTLLQFGYALEAEYRLLDDKLGIYFDTGFATGDPDVEGLSSENGLVQQQQIGDVRADTRISTFAFHRNYRIDLILWRNILGQVAGAYYFRPGVSYDILRSPFGERLGGMFHLVWSRASVPVQSYGSEPDLGVELDFRLYYNSDDGPGLLDGFHAQLMYGILFPLAGLGYADTGNLPAVRGGNPDLASAQTLRLLLGVKF